MKKPVVGRKLLTVGVVGDTHVNESEDFSASPYPANALANARARSVVAAVQAMHPDFVMHMGDMINPVPALPAYAQAVKNFQAIAQSLTMPLYVLPGNHDIGDKPVDWMPAGQVDEKTMALYEHSFGKSYYWFERANIIFIAINASIINSGLAAEKKQQQWLERTLAEQASKRIFIFIHYPPFITTEEELGSYDNLDEPGRSWLLSLVRQYQPEGLFAGHVHNFWYNRVGNTECYILPSTAFVRHDYSEMYRIGPGDQNGRNDVAKLGYAKLNIYEQGHILDIIRSYGRVQVIGQSTVDKTAVAETTTDGSELTHARRLSSSIIGLDMRQPWAEIVEIPPSGGVDEFGRKKARNDYPLMALWEMGIRRMRIPIQDILDSQLARRIELLHDIGQIFHVYCYGIPTGHVRQQLAKQKHLFSAVEIVLNWDGVAMDLTALEILRQEISLPLYLSRINRHDHAKRQQERYNHFISHCFTLDEMEELIEWRNSNQRQQVVDGLMMRLSNDINPSDVVRQAALLAIRLDKQIALYMRTSSANPADNFCDDAVNTARIVEAIVACSGVKNVVLFLDTFADVDRGYFARSGLVDRRFNPKMGGRVVSVLMRMLDQQEWKLSDKKDTDSPDLILELIGMENRQSNRLQLLRPDEGSVIPTIVQIDKAGNKVLSRLEKDFKETVV